MNLSGGRKRDVVGVVWLIGLGILLLTRAWWPGIMFVIAATAMVQGYFDGKTWYGVQAGWWSAFFGLWVLMRHSPVWLFVGLGVSMICASLVRPGPFAKPKPFMDSSLE